MKMHFSTITRATRLGWVVLCLFLSACHLDMYDQPKHKTYTPSQFFTDGSSARPVVPNTVAVEQIQTDSALTTGRVNGNLITDLPTSIPRTPELLKLGQTRFNTYCSPCHGLLGDGQGIIAVRGPLTVTSLQIQRLRDVEVGYIFEVMTNGLGRMYNYAARIPVAERWAVVAYVRALQLSQNATVDDIPPAERSQFGK